MTAITALPKFTGMRLPVSASGSTKSGDDYAYAADRFYPIDLPAELERALISAA